jgi:hypothetical protein
MTTWYEGTADSENALKVKVNQTFSKAGVPEYCGGHLRWGSSLVDGLVESFATMV